MKLDEDATLDAVLSGRSLARFGDGEFNLACGQPCITQAPSYEIKAALRDVLMNGRSLVGLPRFGVGPKAKFWQRYDRADIWALLNPAKTYGSAFITRPDSAPWIDRPDYWAKVKSLWAGKDVTLVRGSEKSLTADMLVDAKRVREVIAPNKNAFAHRKALLDDIGAPETVLLCLGPTATVMANDLCEHGCHAIDVGHVGMFLRKHERGEPMAVTDTDRAVDRS